MWWLLGLAQSFAWIAVCAWAAPGYGRRFFVLLIAGVALNLSGYGEGRIRQMVHDHPALAGIRTPLSLPRAD